MCSLHNEINSLLLILLANELMQPFPPGSPLFRFCPHLLKVYLFISVESDIKLI